MFTETRKVLLLAALIVLAGVLLVELTRQPAQADALHVTGGAAGYAGSRIDAVFVMVGGEDAAPATSRLASKSDFPQLGCVGPFRAEFEAECLDAAAELASDEYIVVETRSEAVSVLTRMPLVELAGF